MRSARRRWLWLVPAAATSICLGALVINALSGWEPGPYGWLLAPNSPVLLPLTIGLLLTTLVVYWWPRRQQSPTLPVVGAAVVAAIALTLGLAAYWPCTSDEAPVVAPLTWSLALFAGEVHTAAFAPGAICEGPYPLALQLGRTLALAVTFAGVTAAGLTLWSSGFQRLRARRSGDVDVVIGLNRLSEPVVRALVEQARHARTGKRRVVAVASDEDPWGTAELSRAGVIVVRIDPTREDELGAVITRSGRPAARRIYVLSDSGHHNRDVAATVRGILEEVPEPSPAVPTVLVRLDDPREADSWRVGHALDANSVVMDAVSATEVTAGQLVNLATEQGVHTINLVGDGPMLFALLSELAVHHAWSAALSDASSSTDEPLPLPTSLMSGVLVRVFTSDPDAELEWQLMRRRAETTSRLPRLVVEFENGAPRVHDLVPPQVADVATIYVGPPQPTTLDAASRLARLRPESTVLVPDDRVVGVARVAAHGRLYRYGLSLTPHDGTLPPGGWDRMARLQHEVYRHRSLSRGQSSRPTQMPWNELDEAVRESNAEQIRTVMRAVRDLGYEWVSTSDGDDSGLPNEHRGDVAEQMHEAWVQAKRAAGYVYGEPSNPAADPPTNSYLVPWADLSEEKQRENEQQVEAAVSRVTVFGLTPKQPAQRSGHGPHPPLSQEAGQPQQ